MKRLFLGISQKIETLFFGLEESNYTRTQTFDTNAQSIMTDAQITALTNKLKAARKETKNFLKMIEKSDVSSKVEATKDETPEEPIKHMIQINIDEDNFELEEYPDYHEAKKRFRELEDDDRYASVIFYVIHPDGVQERCEYWERPEDTLVYRVVGEWIVLSTEEGIPHGTQEGDAEEFNTMKEARVCFQKWIDEQFDEDEPYENIRIESFKKDEWGFGEDYETIECWEQEEDHRFQCYKADKAAVEHFKARN